MTMISASRRLPQGDRPDFMIVLGLLPPYTVDDVKQAYLTRVKTAHPDVGGDTTGFVRLQEAFERAIEYARLHADWRAWVSSHVERYVSQQAILCKLRDYGARVDIESMGWLNRALGVDFAQLAEELVGIHLHGPKIGDEVLDYLFPARAMLGKLRLLDLAQTHVGDRGLQHLPVLTSLKHLDLSDTPVTYQGLNVLQRLPALEVLDLRGTSVDWWGRIKLRWFFRELNVITSQSPRKAGRLTRRPKCAWEITWNLLNAVGARTTKGRQV